MFSLLTEPYSSVYIHKHQRQKKYEYILKYSKFGAFSLSVSKFFQQSEENLDTSSIFCFISSKIVAAFLFGTHTTKHWLIFQQILLKIHYSGSNLPTSSFRFAKRLSSVFTSFHALIFFLCSR